MWLFSVLLRKLSECGNQQLHVYSICSFTAHDGGIFPLLREMYMLPKIKDLGLLSMKASTKLENLVVQTLKDEQTSCVNKT